MALSLDNLEAVLGAARLAMPGQLVEPEGTAVA